MQIHDDVWVTVRYRLFDAQGEAIEPTERELTYLQGNYGAVFPRIEEALAGHGVGFATSIQLEPEDSFGDYDPELLQLAPRGDFPDELEIGMTFEGMPGDDEGGDDEEAHPLFIVTDFTDEAVVLDGNHPLAGMALRFELRVTGVRPASDDEVERERAMREVGEAAGIGPGDDDSLLVRAQATLDALRGDDGDDDEDEAQEDGLGGPPTGFPNGGPDRRRLH